MVIDGVLTQGHARALLGLDDPALLEETAKKIAENGYNVRQTEALVSSIQNPQKDTANKTISPMMQKYYKDVEASLSSRLGTKVKIKEGAKKGKIEIDYYSKDDLERILFELRQ